MMIFKELWDSTKKLASWRKNYPDVDGKLVDIIPNLHSNLLTFKYRVQSVAKRNEGYNVYIQFYNIEFSDKPVSSRSIKIVHQDTNKPLYFERVSLADKASKNYVRVRCSCMDFRHRFAWEDKENNALFGPPPPKYTPKPGSNRPPVNPNHYPGFCKHIWCCVRDSQHYFTR